MLNGGGVILDRDKKITKIHIGAVLVLALAVLSLPTPAFAFEEKSSSEWQELLKKHQQEEEELRARHEEENKSLKEKLAAEVKDGEKEPKEKGKLSGFWGRLKGKVKNITSGDGDQADSEGLTDEEISAGLKEALRVGAKQATGQASAAGGFYNNQEIHIPIPKKMHKMAKILNRYGLGKHVNTFEETLNLAAEKASVKALPILNKAVAGLTLEDAREIWKGKRTAITDYFKKESWQDLYDRLKPVVQDTIGEAGVTRAYKTMVDFPAVETLADKIDLDLDHYVTEKTLNGLFTLLAEEEEKIRTVPIARTTEILTKVFGE